MRIVIKLGAAAAAIAAATAFALPAIATGHGKSHKCAPHWIDYHATGTLTTWGGTPAGKKDHFNGSITVDVMKANHHAPTGSQTFTLSNTEVKFHHGTSPTDPSGRDSVNLDGKMSVVGKRCGPFTSSFTLHHVDVNPPKSHK